MVRSRKVEDLRFAVFHNQAGIQKNFRHDVIAIEEKR